MLEQYKSLPSKTVSCHIWNVSSSFFKVAANERSFCKTVTCCLDSCSLRDKGECQAIPVLSSSSCPYGKYSCENGYTKRHSKSYTWLAQKQEQYKGIPSLKSPTKKLTFIGDYVFLPYHHMDSNKNLPFLSHSEAFVSGVPFIPKTAWTIDNVLKIVGYRPYALMGGEITSYQKEEVPKFIEHLREVDSSMFGELIKVCPQFDTVPNYVGRKAFLSTLNFPIAWTETNEKYGYPVTWEWDGVMLETKSPHVYQATWGGNIKMESFTFRGIPDASTVVVVRDNFWVNDKTEFKD